MINIDKLQTLMWMLFDEVVTEEQLIQELQKQEAQDLKQLLKGN